MTFASSWPIMRMERAGYEGISTDCTRGGTGSARKPRIPGQLLRARLLLREELKGIEKPTVRHHLVMEMGAGRAAGAAKPADHLAALDVITLMNQECREVAVSSFKPESVIEDDEISVTAGESRLHDDTGSCRIDRLALLTGDIETAVIIRVAGQRIRARPHCRRQPALRRPDRRGRGGEGVAFLDVGANRLKT